MRSSARLGRNRRGRGGSGKGEARKSFMVTEGGIVETGEKGEQRNAAAAVPTAPAKDPVKTSFSPTLLETLKKEKKVEAMTEPVGGGESDKRIHRVFDAAIREGVKYNRWNLPSEFISKMKNFFEDSINFLILP